MMDDWKELDIANLPPDILVGDYEFISKCKGMNNFTSPWLAETLQERKVIIENIDEYDYQYRKRAPKAPTHEERIAGCVNRINSAVKTFGYKEEVIEAIQDAVLYLLVKSADIPPES